MKAKNHFHFQDNQFENIINELRQWNGEFRKVYLAASRNISANAYTLKELMKDNGDDSSMEMLKMDIEGTKFEQS